MSKHCINSEEVRESSVEAHLRRWLHKKYGRGLKRPRLAPVVVIRSKRKICAALHNGSC